METCYNDLFDLSSLQPSSLVSSAFIGTDSIGSITIPRVKLPRKGGTIEFTDEEFYLYYQEEKAEDDRQHNDHTGTLLDHNGSSKKENRDSNSNYNLQYSNYNALVVTEYNDSDTITTTATANINSSSVKKKNPSTKLRLGQYKSYTEDSKLYWSPCYQCYTRKCKLLTRGMLISDTYSIVTVYTYGITGRLFGGGSGAKLLMIDVYSRWNSAIYTLTLDATRLRGLLQQDPELQGLELDKPGNKHRLIESLLRRLYFQYELVLPSNDPLHVQVSNENNEEILKDEHVEEAKKIIVNHLERPDIPEYYPYRSVAEITNNYQNQEIVITQLLQVSNESVTATNGREARRQDRMRQQLLLEEEEERKKKAWLSIPKRNRGLVTGSRRCLRNCGRIAVLSAYVFPLRPKAVTVSCYNCNDGSRMYLQLGIAQLKHFYRNNHKKNRGSSNYTETDEDNRCIRRAVECISLATVNGSNGSVIARVLSAGLGVAGAENTISRLDSCDQIHIGKVNRLRYYGNHNYYSHVGNDMNVNSSSSSSNDSCGDSMERCVVVNDHISHSCYGGKVVGYTARRDIGRGTVVAGGARNISGIYCLYTLYRRFALATPLPTQLQASVSTASDSEARHLLLQQYCDAHLPDTPFDVDVYVPHAGTYDGYPVTEGGYFRFVLRLDVLLLLLGVDVFICNVLTITTDSYDVIAASILNKLRFMLVYSQQYGNSYDGINEAIALSTVTATTASTAVGLGLGSDAIWPPVPTFVLGISVIVFKKHMRIACIHQKKGEKDEVRTTVSLWHKDASIGIICYHYGIDSDTGDTYMVCDIPLHVQTQYIQSTRWMDSITKFNTWSVFVASYIRYDSSRSTYVFHQDDDDDDDFLDNNDDNDYDSVDEV